MGSSGSYLKSGGFTSQEWEQIGSINGVKVLREKGIKKGTKGDLPFYSNTPGTAYILSNIGGSFSQFRQYRENRMPAFDIDYGIHKGRLSLHIHKYGSNGRSKEPKIIAYPNGAIINKNLYEKYKGFLKGIKL